MTIHPIPSGSRQHHNEASVAGPLTKQQRAHLIVPGMGSDHCAGLVATSLKRLSGVGEVHTNIANHRVNIEFNPAQLNADDLSMAVEKAGYEVDSVSTEGSAELHLTVPGMGSDHCAGLITTSLQRLSGILKVDTKLATHRVIVNFDSDQLNAATIEAAVERAGYEVVAVKSGSTTTPQDASNPTPSAHPQSRWITKLSWIIATGGD